MRAIFIILLLLWTATDSVAQSGLYFYGPDFGITDSPESSSYKKEVLNSGPGTFRVNTFQQVEGSWARISKEKIRLKNDSLLVIRRTGEKVFKESVKRIFTRTGENLYEFKDRKKGNILLSGKASSVVPLHKEDTVSYFYSNGQLKSQAVFSDNRLISNRNWHRNGQEYVSDIHYYVDKLPEYSLGQLNFRNHILSGIKESGIDLSQFNDRVVVAGSSLKQDRQLAIRLSQGYTAN